MRFEAFIHLVSFFYRDGLHGMGSSRLLRNAWVRGSIIAVMVCAYIFYLYYNMVVLSQMSFDPDAVERSALLHGSYVVLASYFDMSAFFAVIIYVLVNYSFSLSKVSLFHAKSLPFSALEISMGCITVKISLGLLLFELLLVIVASGLAMIPLTFSEMILVLLAMHAVFVCIFVALLFLKYLINSLFRGSWGTILEMICNAAAVITASFFAFSWRYQWELDIANTVTDLDIGFTSSILAVLFVVTCLLMICLLGIMYLPLGEKAYSVSVYMKLGMPAAPPPYSLSSCVVRHRGGLCVLCVTLLAGVVSCINAGDVSSMTRLMQTLPFLGACFLYYADSNVPLSNLLSLYRLSVYEEYAVIAASITIMQMPVVATGLLSGSGMRIMSSHLGMGVSVSFAALIVGYALPKSEGSMNETLSIMLLIPVMMLLAAAETVRGAALSIAIVLAVMAFSVMKKERNAQ